MKNFLRRIPKLPLTALIFYLGVFILWNLKFIPPPTQIVIFLENLYTDYGFIGLAIASFLEGIVYLGLYFPGSFIVALAVIFSDGSFFTLLTISLVVALVLTITSIINYFLGRHVVFRRTNEEFFGKHKNTGKGLFLSMIHPNSLAFYFFNEGIEKGNPMKIIFVPIIMIPYGLLFAYLLSISAEFSKQRIESPYFMISVILTWFIIAFILEYKKRYRK